MCVGECIAGKNERKIQTHSHPNKQAKQINQHTDTTICGSSPHSVLHLSTLRRAMSIVLCLVSPAPKQYAGTDSKGLVFCPELSSRSAITPEYDIMSLYLIFLGYQSSSHVSLPSSRSTQSPSFLSCLCELFRLPSVHQLSQLFLKVT